MKKTTLLVLLVIACVSVVLVESCKKATEICPDITCLNGGTKVSSGSSCSCNCAAGYTGSKCQTESRASYYGTYTMNCYDESYNSCGTHTASVAAGSGGTSTVAITMDGVTLQATLSTYYFTISKQTVSGVAYSGSGTFTSGILAFSLTKEVSGISSTNQYQGY